MNLNGDQIVWVQAEQFNHLLPGLQNDGNDIISQASSSDPTSQASAAQGMDLSPELRPPRQMAFVSIPRQLPIPTNADVPTNALMTSSVSVRTQIPITFDSSVMPPAMVGYKVPDRYQNFKGEVFRSLEEARAYSHATWKPKCTTLNVPRHNAKKRRWVKYIAKCMLNFNDFGDKPSTWAGNKFLKGSYELHHVFAAASHVVDGSVAYHLHGRQNRGSSDPSLDKNGNIVQSQRDMEFPTRMKQLGNLFMSNKKAVYDVIKGDIDLEIYCIIAPGNRLTQPTLVVEYVEDEDNVVAAPREIKGGRPSKTDSAASKQRSMNYDPADAPSAMASLQTPRSQMNGLFLSNYASPLSGSRYPVDDFRGQTGVIGSANRHAQPMLENMAEGIDGHENPILSSWSFEPRMPAFDEPHPGQGNELGRYPTEGMTDMVPGSNHPNFIGTSITSNAADRVHGSITGQFARPSSLTPFPAVSAPTAPYSLYGRHSPPSYQQQYMHDYHVGSARQLPRGQDMVNPRAEADAAFDMSSEQALMLSTPPVNGYGHAQPNMAGARARIGRSMHPHYSGGNSEWTYGAPPRNHNHNQRNPDQW